MNDFHVVRNDCARDTIPIAPDLVRIWNSLFILDRLFYTQSGNLLIHCLLSVPWVFSPDSSFDKHYWSKFVFSF